MEVESARGNDLGRMLDEAERRIREHPAAIEHGMCLSIEWSLTAVFQPNLREVLALLDAAATDETLAIELIQNVRPPIVREQFHRLVAQRLHNYLASAASLVDHVRRVMRDRNGDIADEFQRRKSVVLADPEIRFVFDLRHYTVHRALPLIGHRFAEKSGGPFESEVQIGVPALKEWDGWSNVSQGFLQRSADSIPLRPLIRKHGDFVGSLNVWLHNALADANAARLSEVDQLVVARNAILVGGDLELARRITAESTARRSLVTDTQAGRSHA